jgi:DHHC palmitoyltransferase
MNVAQRRGKGAAAEKATAMTTVMVSDLDDDTPTTKNGGSITSVGGATIGGGGGSGADLMKMGATTATTDATTAPPAIVRVATVRRNMFGTGPFDKHWLNLDCCGLICALFTYFLHGFGVYAVNFVLLPPWMSNSYTIATATTHDSGETTAADTVRTLSFFGLFHTFGFLFVSFMAIASHFYAMTTDPGAVPPDAKPLSLHGGTDDDSAETGLSVRPQEMQSLMDPLPTPPGVKRLCRRCKTFKPQRAHHCSVCQRCIIKMDHHCPYVRYMYIDRVSPSIQ